MKKTFALLMTIVMVLSMTACGGKKEQPATTPETPPAQSGENANTDVGYPTMTIRLAQRRSPDHAPSRGLREHQGRPGGALRRRHHGGAVPHPAAGQRL